MQKVKSNSIFMTDAEFEKYISDSEAKFDAELAARAASADAERKSKAAAAEAAAAEAQRVALAKASAPTYRDFTPRPKQVDILAESQKVYEQQKAQLDVEWAEHHRKAKEAITKGEKADFSKMPELEARSATLKKERERLTREESWKDIHKRQFLAAGIGNDSDFSRLWNDRLRDEALVSLATGETLPMVSQAGWGER